MRIRAGGSIPGRDMMHPGDAGTRYAALWPPRCEEASKVGRNRPCGACCGHLRFGAALGAACGLALVLCFLCRPARAAEPLSACGFGQAPGWPQGTNPRQPRDAQPWRKGSVSVRGMACFRRGCELGARPHYQIDLGPRSNPPRAMLPVGGAWICGDRAIFKGRQRLTRGRRGLDPAIPQSLVSCWERFAVLLSAADPSEAR